LRVEFEGVPFSMVGGHSRLSDDDYDLGGRTRLVLGGGCEAVGRVGLSDKIFYWKQGATLSVTLTMISENASSSWRGGA
jgi:hypothetical protein